MTIVPIERGVKAKTRSMNEEMKGPRGCVLVLLLLIPVLSALTVETDTAVAACTCPYGGRYYARIHTSLCGWQYNVCVTFDYNCSNDYPGVCGRTTTRTTRTITTRTTGKTCSYGCPYGGTYYPRLYTRLCGWQYNVCVTFDNNCSNDYPAVSSCGSGGCWPPWSKC